MDFQSVSHLYSEIKENEIDPITGCTVCKEDQVEIDIASIPSFKVCYLIAPNLKTILVDLLSSDEPVFEIVGYRVGKTRGEIDDLGNRTVFSNHSFGIAVDINPDINGLYDNCLNFSQECRLIKGGQWQPNHPGSMTENSMIVHAMEGIGFLWGGKISGKQKDFMHFSPTGY